MLRDGSAVDHHDWYIISLMSMAVGSLVVFTPACCFAFLSHPSHPCIPFTCTFCNIYFIAIYVRWARVSPPPGPSGLGAGMPGFEVQIWPFSPHSITLALRSCVSFGNEYFCQEIRFSIGGAATRLTCSTHTHAEIWISCRPS